MNRSGFLKQLIASIAIGKLPVSLTKDFRKIYLLQCFVAGFRHYEGMQLLDRMKEGDLFELVREPEDDNNRVINLDTIPAEQVEAKNHFEKYYSKYPVSINKRGRFLHVKDDGIYTYMYEIGDDIQLVKDNNGEGFMEFFLTKISQEKLVI